MSLLFKHFRIHQIFGANTDVGKTILTTALVRGSAALKNRVFYLKPISTGHIEDADDEHIQRHGGPSKDKIETACLYRFHVPVSPHLAAQLAVGDESQKIVSDKTFVNSIASHLERCATQSTTPADMYVETAGGVHSPTLSGVTQLDCYRPLFLPTILVGDSRLGGISATISAYESLLLRGYIVDAILLFRDEYYRNSDYLTPYFAERGVEVVAFDAPPPIPADVAEKIASTERYYDHLVSKGGILPLLRNLDTRHEQRIAELSSMARRSQDTFWWPFVQHGLVKSEEDVTVIDSASSDFFSVHKSNTTSGSSLQSQLDGSASWWTQALGHAHPSLTLAAARASGRYGHVMFPQATHAPALQLAESLLQSGPGKGWASRVFFSDDGSTGMEVALKMALRAFSVREGLEGADRKALGVLGLRGSYHGDTIGAMDACAEEGVYTCEWHNAKGFWFDPPTVSIQQGRPVITLPPALASGAEPSDPDVTMSWVYDVAERLETPLAAVYRAYIERTLESLEKEGGPRLAALVLEPLVMGAGGMIFVDPLFQRVLVDVVRARGPAPEELNSWRGMPVIFDEVFVGLYRLGMQSTIPLLGITPDVSVHAKILTGGLVPLAVTLASDSVFRAFHGTEKASALLHGHSYTAHALGCEVANETLRLVEKETQSEAWTKARALWEPSPGTQPVVWSLWDPQFLHTVSCMDKVAEVMAMGTVLSIKFKDPEAGYVSHSAQTWLQSIKCYDPKSFSVHFRTLGMSRTL
ncbi:PLP-dependent transferase [Roridomyces roridus]|uniref:PLP-dependent transferase n=1 Tax=Roridomyces roridus TaxID=1738132 RepID=A0AAD7BHC6_9AGAR|nr:PLP-dependent transferase [Roridomyces roridus]